MPEEPKRLSLEEIKQFIPHRPPFLWLDEVTELTPTRIVAVKRVPEDLDLFRGHYPSFPVLPGVLQCEAAFQAGAVLIAQLMPKHEDPGPSAESEPSKLGSRHSAPVDQRVPVVTRLNNVQFRRMVRPGETLTLEVELSEHLSNAYFLKGKISVDGQVCVRLEFACTAASVQ